MSSFNRIVLEIAIVILIIALIVIGWTIHNSLYGPKVQFPPIEGTCPDYWTAENINGVTYCKNNLQTGPNMKDSVCQMFPSNSVTSDCQKWAIANTCKIPWDGITDNSTLVTKCSKTATPQGTDPGTATSCPASRNGNSTLFIPWSTTMSSTTVLNPEGSDPITPQSIWQGECTKINQAAGETVCSVDSAGWCSSYGTLGTTGRTTTPAVGPIDQNNNQMLCNSNLVNSYQSAGLNGSAMQYGGKTFSGSAAVDTICGNPLVITCGQNYTCDSYSTSSSGSANGGNTSSAQ